MARGRFTQAEVTRAIKAAQSAGLVVSRLEIEPDGKITVFTVPDQQPSSDAERALDAWREQQRHQVSDKPKLRR